MFTKEIALMMHGFGDSSKPLEETVRLVESITLNQIRGILSEAFQQAERRGSDVVDVDDILFLLRSNPGATQRLLRFLKNKKIKRYDQLSNKSANVSTSLTEKPIKQIKIVIDTLDETGELADLNASDTVKLERQLRADTISTHLDANKYLEYHQARCTSFLNKNLSLLKNLELFRRWILNNDDKTKLSNPVLEILTYLAYETIAQIVDLAFIVRNDVNRQNDPVAGLSVGNYCNPVSFDSSQVLKCLKETGKTVEGQIALSVTEVREAMRRFEQTPIKGFLRGTTSRKRKRYLAC